MDNELFKLCDVAYQRTKWWPKMTQYHQYYTRFDHSGKLVQWYETSYFGPKDDSGKYQFPRYTVELLLRRLETLGHTITLRYHSPSEKLATDAKEWSGMYTASTANMPMGEYPYHEDPLKALLLLVIQLFPEL